MQVQDYLASHDVAFHTIHHPRTVGALRIAQSIAVSGNSVAKTVVLEADGQPVLAVLPATRLVDLERVRMALGAHKVRLMSEERCNELFDDCERGAIPPLGISRGMCTVMDASLVAQEDMFFEGNRHDEAIHLRTADYERIEHPLIANFSHPIRAEA